MQTEIAVLATTVTQVPGLLDRLREHFEVHLMHRPELFDADAAARCRAVVTSGGVGAGAATFEAFPRAELYASFGVGYDSIDLAEARRRGLRVTNTPGVLAADVADMALALALAVARGLLAGDAYARSGDWARLGPMRLQRRLSGLKAGVLGLGAIGKAVARRAEAFDMEVFWSGPRPKPDQPWPYLETPAALACRADVLFVCCTGGPETRHLVNTEVLEALGPEGILVNVARGSVVDQAALIRALEAGRLYGAGLDVLDGEPQVPPGLAASERVVLQPHHATGTVETRQAMGALVLENLLAHFAARPLPTPLV